MGFYRVNLTNTTALILPLGEGKEVTIEGNALNMNELKISGSAEAVALAEFNKFNTQIAEKQRNSKSRVSIYG